MRSLFGAGKDFVQFGMDFSSLEFRVQAHYIFDYEGGPELGKSLVAEKPNDIHTVNSLKMGISRTDAKSVGYGSLYGASPAKLAKMLKLTKDEGKRIYDDYWEAVRPLKELKEDCLAEFEQTGKKYILGIDGRKLFVRSPHSILNMLFQSAGVIFAKYVTVSWEKAIRDLGFNTDPFSGKPEFCMMCEYHDENQAATLKDVYNFEVFETEKEAEEFVNSWPKELGQLSSIGHSAKGYYVCLPNSFSKSLSVVIDEMVSNLGFKVPLGMEWIVGRTWYDCH